MIRKSFNQRMKSPTPPYFKKVGRWGLAIGGVGTAILAISATVVLPAFLITAAGYLLVAGAILKGVSSLTMETENMTKKH